MMTRKVMRRRIVGIVTMMIMVKMRRVMMMMIALNVMITIGSKCDTLSRNSIWSFFIQAFASNLYTIEFICVISTCNDDTTCCKCCTVSALRWNLFISVDDWKYDSKADCESFILSKQSSEIFSLINNRRSNPTLSEFQSRFRSWYFSNNYG